DDRPHGDGVLDAGQRLHPELCSGWIVEFGPVATEVLHPILLGLIAPGLLLQDFNFLWRAPLPLIKFVALAAAKILLRDPLAVEELKAQGPAGVVVVWIQFNHASQVQPPRVKHARLAGTAHK